MNNGEHEEVWMVNMGMKLGHVKAKVSIHMGEHGTYV